MPTPTGHAFLSPSSAHRWLACTAAPHFEADFPDGTSSFAEEGTLAHSVCELYGRKRFTIMSKQKFEGELKKLKAKPHYDDEMLRTAERYVEVLNEEAVGLDGTVTPYVAFEVSVDLTAWVPDGKGQLDNTIIGGDTLFINDYKHGKGVRVSAKDNPQMRLYALGALAMYRPIFGDQIKKVCMTIIQPRLSDEPDRETLTVEELRAWGESIKPLALEAYTGPGKFTPGEHCRFCKGKAQCRARAEQNTALADFAGCVPAGKPDAHAEIGDPTARRVLGLPPLLSDDEVGELLEHGAQLVDWYNDLKAYAMQAILDGKSVAGWKVVAGRSNRTLTNTDAAIEAMISAGYDRALLVEEKPLTITGYEKLLGKKQFEEVCGQFIEKPLGKPTLAPESDKREPYSTAASDFAGAGNG